MVYYFYIFDIIYIYLYYVAFVCIYTSYNVSTHFLCMCKNMYYIYIYIYSFLQRTVLLVCQEWQGCLLRPRFGHTKNWNLKVDRPGNRSML